ncbi:MAG: dihydrolipoyl dehydrogenase [Syntrophomonadaceae bacterium]|nr:dihydrolipoyl dehydrogenase [Syntrophomonadaceae bacterium]
MKDLVIIGGGPGGYTAAIRARQLGMETVLIERDRYGGTCLNRGCIPTKAYCQNAAVLRHIRNSEEFSIEVGEVRFDMAGALQRKDSIVTRLVSGVEKLLKDHGVEKIKGQAGLVDKNTVLVDDQTITARNLLLATGSLPAPPSFPILDPEMVIDSDELLELAEVPENLTIIGGGVVGLEFAGIFSAFGSQVTVLESQPELLPAMDLELGKRLRVFMKRQKIAIHTGVAVERIESPYNPWQVTAISKHGAIQVQADRVLNATGRRPCCDGLNLDRLGIVTDARGFIKVDRQMATNIEGVYAIGDVTGGAMLAHVASAEGVVAVENMAGITATVPYHAIPACVFTSPEIASVGLSEEQARSLGIAYRTGKFQFAANGKALALGESEGMVKVLADREDTIIGMHIIGPHASDLIMEGTLLVQNRLQVNDVTAAVHPHPTLSEAVMEAVLDIKGRAIHLSPPRR